MCSCKQRNQKGRNVICVKTGIIICNSKIFMNDLQIYLQILIAIGILISTAKKSLIRKTQKLINNALFVHTQYNVNKYTCVFPYLQFSSFNTLCTRFARRKINQVFDLRSKICAVLSRYFSLEGYDTYTKYITYVKYLLDYQPMCQVPQPDTMNK